MSENKLEKISDDIPKAVLVDIIDPQTTKIEADIRLQELESLVTTYGGIVIEKTIQRRALPDYKTYIGSGKANEILEMAEEKPFKLLIINNILKPGQLYSLNEKFREKGIEAWDRIDLILNIFEKHAKSTEAKLQVDLARIKHMGPRIFGMGEELSRQGGAVGMRAGGGESNIEMMKRHLRRQELKIEEKLKHYETIKEGHRSKRKRNNFKTVSLVGYTNAGKSSLLNALTNKGAYVADALFATLDTRVGKLYIEPDEKFKDGKYVPGKEILVSDTIGFIQDLPPFLIKAFKSTLAEAIDSDVLLHVIDVTDPMMYKKIEVVEEILEQLGVGEKEKVYVFNKIDLIDYDYLFDEEDLEAGVFDPEKPVGMVKAGKMASVKLGWTTIDEKLAEQEENLLEKNIKVHPPKKLKKDFSNFSPVFVSANDGINLERLINLISSLT